MAYSDNAYTADAINQLTGLLSGAIEAQAMRPQKTSTTTTTTSTNTPYALADLIARRDSIGRATQNLDDILRAREGFMYRFGQGLANVTPQDQSGAGWLSGFLRGVGGGLTGGVDNRVARAQQKYENEMKDLAQILAYDKAMGDTTTQIQNQSIAYTPMEYGTAKSNQNRGAGADSVGGVQSTNFGRSVGYDPVENLPDFGPITRAALSEEQVNPLLKYVGGQSLAKGLTDKTATELQSTWSDISDNILSGRVLDFVGKAGSIRVADTPAEQEFIFGPIRNYQNMTKSQLQAGLKQARNNFVTAGLNKARQQGIEISEDELKTWWNSAFSVPEGKQTEKMYNIQDKPSTSAAQTNKSTPVVGEVRNGVKFLGYNEDGSMKFEKVQ